MFLMRENFIQRTHHDMANWPVEGSDNFLHLSCVTDDMISIVETVLLHLRLQSIMQGQEEIKRRNKGKVPKRRPKAINGPSQVAINKYPKPGSQEKGLVRKVNKKGLSNV